MHIEFDFARPFLSSACPIGRANKIARPKNRARRSKFVHLWWTFSQIIEQIDVIQEVLFSELNDSTLDKKQGEQTECSSKRDSRKKMDLILSIMFTVIPIDGSCYIVINSSILREFFFHPSQNVHHAMKKKY